MGWSLANSQRTDPRRGDCLLAADPHLACVYEHRAPPRRDPLNPFPWYRLMHAQAPVFFEPDRQLWHAFRYADVERVLSEHADFSSQFIGGGEDTALSSSLVATDPPRHASCERS